MTDLREDILKISQITFRHCPCPNCLVLFSRSNMIHNKILYEVTFKSDIWMALNCWETRGFDLWRDLLQPNEYSCCKGQLHIEHPWQLLIFSIQPDPEDVPEGGQRWGWWVYFFLAKIYFVRLILSSFGWFWGLIEDWRNFPTEGDFTKNCPRLFRQNICSFHLSYWEMEMQKPSPGNLNISIDINRQAYYQQYQKWHPEDLGETKDAIKTAKKTTHRQTDWETDRQTCKSHLPNINIFIIWAKKYWF